MASEVQLCMRDVFSPEEMSADIFMTESASVYKVSPHKTICCIHYFEKCQASFFFIDKPPHSFRFEIIGYFYCSTKNIMWRSICIHVMGSYTSFAHICYMKISKSEFEQEAQNYINIPPPRLATNMLFDVLPLSPENETEEETQYAPFVEYCHRRRSRK